MVDIVQSAAIIALSLALIWTNKSIRLNCDAIISLGNTITSLITLLIRDENERN
jgi:hypothetical protein